MSEATLTGDEIKAEPTASIRIVLALREAVILAGVPRPEFLRRAGLNEAQLNDTHTRLSYSQIWSICELAMELTQDPALGLHWAESHPSHSFIPMTHLIAHAGSLREGLASLAQFERLISDEPNTQVIEDGEFFTLRCTPAMQEASPAMKRFGLDMMVASFLRLFRWFNPLLRPLRISIEHAAPAYQAEYERILGQQVQFAAPHTELVFERALLDAPSPFRDDDLHGAVVNLAQDRITRLTHGSTYALRVRDHLLKHGAHERVAMDSVARALGLSVRSLRRRLDAEGKSYGELENEALTTVAKHLLRDKQLTIQETAYAMGFTNASTFHRAFKRWTGTTPNTARPRKPGG